MRTVCLSGWGQPHDALSVIAPDADHVDYAHAANIDEVFRMLAPHRDAEQVIGWSLGGQLAIRAIDAGILTPSQLVLIAAPYQFVASDNYVYGMPLDSYEKFEANYAKNPLRTLTKAWDLIHYNDTQSGYIKGVLNGFDKEAVMQRDWLRWLRQLGQYSCAVVNFNVLPPTLIFHGDKDVVVSEKQSDILAENIPNARMVSWAGCGHAPHFHDAEKLQQMIFEHADV